MHQYASRTYGQQVLNYGVFGNTGSRDRVDVGTWSMLRDLPVKNRKNRYKYYIHSLESNTHSSEKTTHYHAIMKHGDKKQEVSRSVGWNRFAADWKTRTSRGLRLREIVATREYGKEIFVGLYEPGTGGHYLYSLTG